MPAHMEDGETYDLTYAYNKMLSNNRLSWHLEAHRKPKLRTYVKIHDFSGIQTLAKSKLSRYQRSLLSQLKFGILPLKIETDRYQGIPAENRLCTICDLQVPEDELHFMFHCPALNSARNSAKEYFSHGEPQLHFGSDKIETLKIMMTANYLQMSGKYIEALYIERRNIIYK